LNFIDLCAKVDEKITIKKFIDTLEITKDSFIFAIRFLRLMPYLVDIFLLTCLPAGRARF